MGSVVVTNCRAVRGVDAKVDSQLVDLVLREDRIVSIVPSGQGRADEVVDASGCLAVPGVINGHFHSHEHFQKGRFDGETLEQWMNFVRPPKPVRLTPRQVYLRTLVGAIEAARSGTTTVVDDVNIGADLNREYLAAIHQAYEDIGLRAYVGISMMDKPFFSALPFVEEEFEPGLLEDLRKIPIARAGDLLALAEELARSRHPRNNRVGFIISPSAPQRCSDEFLLALRDIADRHDLPAMIHCQETRLQVVMGLLDRGKTHVERLAEIGFLRPKTTLVHGVWLNPDEIKLIASAGATVQHNPWSNLRLSAGLAPVRALLDAGVNVSVATDGCSSTDTCNVLNAVGLVAALQGLRPDPRSAVNAREAFRAATVGSATALGRESELGVIEEGMLADIVLYRLDNAPFVPEGDLVQQLVYAERGGSIHASFVAGRPMIAVGRLVSVDEKAIWAEIIREFEVLRPQYFEAEKSAARMLPAIRRIQSRCDCHPIREDTYQAKFS